MIRGFKILEQTDGRFSIDVEEADRDVLGWKVVASFDDAIREIRRHWYGERDGIDPPPL
jgi:hypothetical protein